MCVARVVCMCVVSRCVCCVCESGRAEGREVCEVLEVPKEKQGPHV